MVGVSVKDVDQHEFVKALSAFFKRSGKLSVPGHVDLIKLSKFKELAPMDADWYYTRAASMARHLYYRAPAGVGAFTKIYGGRFRRGTKPSHFCRAHAGVSRKVLQSLEEINVIEKDSNGGRRLTSHGRRDLDRIASQIANKKK